MDDRERASAWLQGSLGWIDGEFKDAFATDALASLSALIAQVRAEGREQGAEEMRESLSEAIAQISEVHYVQKEERIEELMWALDKFGVHSNTCGDNQGACNCGLSAVEDGKWNEFRATRALPLAPLPVKDGGA